MWVWLPSVRLLVLNIVAQRFSHYIQRQWYCSCFLRCTLVHTFSSPLFNSVHRVAHHYCGGFLVFTEPFRTQCSSLWRWEALGPFIHYPPKVPVALWGRGRRVLHPSREAVHPLLAARQPAQVPARLPVGGREEGFTRSGGRTFTAGRKDSIVWESGIARSQESS